MSKPSRRTLRFVPNTYALLENRYLLSTTTLTFDDLPVGTVLAGEASRQLQIKYGIDISGNGLISKELTQTQATTNQTFPAHSGDQLVFARGNGIHVDNINAIGYPQLYEPWSEVAVYINSRSFNPVTLIAYDRNYNIVASSTTQGTIGFGTPPDTNQRLSVKADNIFSVAINSDYYYPEGTIYPAFSIDDLTVTIPDAPVKPDISLNSAKFNDLYVSQNVAAIQFAYNTTGNTGPFKVGLYLSTDQTFDTTDTFVASTQVTPPVNSSATADIKVNFSLSIPRSKPYLLVVANPDSSVAESTKTNNTVWIPRLVTLTQLRNIMSYQGNTTLSGVDASRYIDPLNRAMVEFAINTPKREAAFLGQIAAETLRLNADWWQEHVSLATGPNYIEYTTDSKSDSHQARARQHGHTDSDDGVKYHGRGPLQLTWKDNYELASMALFGDDRLVDHPELVSDSQNPDIGFRTAAWYFSTITRSNTGSLTANQVADTFSFNNSTTLNSVIDNITLIVNGGINGRDDRRLYTKNALKVLGVF